MTQEIIAGLDQDADGAADTMEIDSESEIRSSTSHLQELRSQICHCEMEVAVATKQVRVLWS